MLPYVTINTDKTGKYIDVHLKFSLAGKDYSKTFNSGDICADFKACSEYADQFQDIGLPVMFSSSVDHWTFDNDGYKWDTIDGRELIVRYDDV